MAGRVGITLQHGRVFLGMSTGGTHKVGKRACIGQVEGKKPKKPLCAQEHLHGNHQASGTRGGCTHQAFVTSGDIVPEAIVTQVHVVTLGAIKAAGSGHFQESSSLRRQQLLRKQQILRRQQLSWVLMASVWQSTIRMSLQQKANTHGQPREWQPLLDKRHGPGARQGHCLPPVQRSRSAPLCTGTQPAWKHLGHSETQQLMGRTGQGGQGGHGGATCSDLFRELGPYLRENRPLESTRRTSKWLSARPRWEGIGLPGQQTARRKWQRPEDDEAIMQRLRKMRKAQEELEDEYYDVVFRAIISSVENKDSPLSSRCSPRDPPSPTLEAAAGPSKQRSTCSVTKDAAAETPKHSELVSLDQSLAELGPASDDSLSCDALVRELLESWDHEELADRETAGDRVSESQSASMLLRQDKEGCVLRDGSSVTPQLVAGSQGPRSTSGVTKDSAGEAEINTEMAPPDLLPHLCSTSADSPACDALLNELLQKWEEKELQDRAAAGERDCEPENVLSLPLKDKKAETAPSRPVSDPCEEEHSESLPMALPEEAKVFEVFSSPADAIDKNDPSWMQAGCAQTVPPQEEPCAAGAPAEAFPVPAQALAPRVPAGPAGSAAVPQTPAPRPWRSMAKTARRALRRLFSFSCLRGQPEE